LTDEYKRKPPLSSHIIPVPHTPYLNLVIPGSFTDDGILIILVANSVLSHAVIRVSVSSLFLPLVS